MSSRSDTMTEEQTGLEERLRAFMEIIIQEARANPGLARRLEKAFGETLDGADRINPEPRRNRRDPPSLDPFILYEQGEDHLRQALASLELDQLKDIVAGHGMDRSRLALRWRTTDRVIELIVDTVKTRTHKGDVFRI